MICLTGKQDEQMLGSDDEGCGLWGVPEWECCRWWQGAGERIESRQRCPRRSISRAGLHTAYLPRCRRWGWQIPPLPGGQQLC